MDVMSILRGAMKQPSTSGAGNNGSDRAQAESEHKAALDHYQTVMRATNDKKQQSDAHDRLMKATEALGKM